MPYENIVYNGYDKVWEGHTFGCGCCSSTDDVQNPTEELTNTAIMYTKMALRYQKLAHYSKNQAKIECAYARYIIYSDAKSNYEILRKVRSGIDCGTFGKELNRLHTLDSLAQNILDAREDMSMEYFEIAELFGW